MIVGLNFSDYAGGLNEHAYELEIQSKAFITRPVHVTWYVC